MKKRIIIGEDKLQGLKKILSEEASNTNLPQFLFKDVKEHNTSLGDSSAFPKTGHYPFDYKITKERYIEVKERLCDMIGDPNPDINVLLSDASKLTKKIKDIEEPLRNNLKKVAENTLTKLFDIPDDTIITHLELVDELKPAHPFRIYPDTGDFQFDDLKDAANASEIIEKRRFVNALIQGASYEFSKNTDYYEDEINAISQELIPLYQKLIAVNDYLLFVKQEKITDDKPMQGGYVEVYLGHAGEKTTIVAEGLIFPYLLHEAVRGLFELFASHSLPEDNAKANYIVKCSDFLLAEPWDLRLGVPLWEKLTDGIDDTRVLPFYFAEVCNLQKEDFDASVSEIIAGTKYGQEVKQGYIDSATNEFNKSDFEHMVQKKNSEVSVINDEYIAADELDNFMLDSDDDKQPLEEENIDEYFTPDGGSATDGDVEIDLDYSFKTGVPFVVLKNNTVQYGESGSTHRDMLSDVVGEILGVDREVIDAINKGKYDIDTDDETGEMKCITEYGALDFEDYTYINKILSERSAINQYVAIYGRLWKGIKSVNKTVNIISIWLNGRFYSKKEMKKFYDASMDPYYNKDIEVPKDTQLKVDNRTADGYTTQFLPTELNDTMKQCIILALENYDCNLAESYLAEGESLINVLDLLDGVSNVSFDAEDMEKMQQARNIHLMKQSEKRDALQGFRNTRDAVWQRKYNQTPSKTGAEWHNMMYQENTEKQSILEYSTPDGVNVKTQGHDGKDIECGLFWYDNSARPFIVLKNGAILTGSNWVKHSGMLKQVYGELTGLDDNDAYRIATGRIKPVNGQYIAYGEILPQEKAEYARELGRNTQLLNKEIYVFGRIWVNYLDSGKSIMSIWLNSRYKKAGEEVSDLEGVEKGDNVFDINNAESAKINQLPSRVDAKMAEVLKKVVREFPDADIDETYLAIGNTTVKLNDLTGDKNVELSDDEVQGIEQAQNIHLMNQDDKREALSDFRKNRDEIWQQQYNKTKSRTGAEWHNMMYQENKRRRKPRIN